LTLDILYQRIYDAQKIRMTEYLFNDFQGHHSCRPDTIQVWSDRFHDGFWDTYRPDEKDLILACRLYVIARDEGLKEAMLWKLTLEV
jgi:hypothetical protein